MSEPSNYRPPAGAVYYTPPHQLDAGRMLIAFPLAAGAAVVGGLIYAKVQPQLLSLQFRMLGVAGAAIATGLLGLAPVRYGKIQGKFVAALIGACIALLALDAMWVVWVHDVLFRLGYGVTWKSLILKPRVLWGLINAINEVGTWEYRGQTERGIGLWIYWFGETAAIVGAGVFGAFHGAGTGDVVCSFCGSKCILTKGLPRLVAACKDDVVAAVEGRDFAALQTFPRRQHEDDPELSIRLESCPRCEKMHVFTINHLAWAIDRGGQPKVKVVPVVNRLLVTRDEAERVKKLKDLPPPETSAPSEVEPDAA